MKRYVQLPLLILCCIAASAQQPKSPDDGSVKDGVYSNRFFGFRFTYPKDWVVHGEATNARIREAGKEVLKGSGALSEASSEVLLKNTYQLLTVFHYPLGTPGIEVNSAIQVIAENVSHAPGITDGRAYLWHVKPFVAKAGAKFIQEQPVELDLAGRRFFRQDYRNEINGTSLRQAYFITIQNGYALVFVYTDSDDTRLEEMMKSLNTIAFDAPSKKSTSKP